MNKEKLAIWASVAAIAGTCIAVIALIPAFGQWLSPQASAQGGSPSNNNSQDSYLPTNVSNNPPVTFFNEWVNVDSQTASIKRVSIQAKDGETYINMFAACSPTDCDYRQSSPNPTVSYNAETQILHVEWVLSYVIMTEELTIEPDGRLKVVSHDHFTDNSGRLDFDSVDYFVRQ